MNPVAVMPKDATLTSGVIRRHESTSSSQIAARQKVSRVKITCSQHPLLKSNSVCQKAKLYHSSQEMWDAVQREFQEQELVDFAGSFVVSNDPVIPDKERVRNVANDLWRLSGFKFTYAISIHLFRMTPDVSSSVRDHPVTSDGHRTRMWCAQDANRRRCRSKNSISSSSAKQRYPCQSHLLISSRDFGTEMQTSGETDRTKNRLVTIRAFHASRHPPFGGRINPMLIPDSPPTSSSALDAPSPSRPPSPSPVPSYSERMLAHIVSIREFCDTVECELQLGATEDTEEWIVRALDDLKAQICGDKVQIS